MLPHKTIDLPEGLINEIQFEITEAPYDSIVHFLRRSIIEFCEKSHYWREDIGPINVTEPTTEYDLPVSQRFTVVSVMAVFFFDQDKKITLFRCATDDVKYRFWQSTPFSIEFFPHEDLIEKSISVIAALKPELQGDVFKFSENLLTDYRDAIVAGAKAALYKIPRKPWTDIGQVQINDDIFERNAAEALRRANRGYSRLPDRAVKKSRTYY